MGAFIAAWLLGEGIIVTRSIRQTHLPPVPGALLASSGLFAGLALLAESESARPLAIALAYGFDLAALLNLWPPVTGGGTATKKTGSGPAPVGGGAGKK